MEIDYINRPSVLGLPCHYYSNSNVIIITFNKGASRFLSDYFQKDTDVELSFDLNFNIIEQSVNNINWYINNLSTDDIIIEWESVKNKKTDKTVIFLYRDPWKRLLSGLVQEYYSAMQPTYTQTYPYSFVLKKFLYQYDGGADVYNFIIGKKFDILFSGNGDVNRIETTKIENVLIQTFEDFLFDISQTPITFMQHTNLYFSYLYNFIKSLDECDNIKLFNLDSEENDLGEVVRGFLDDGVLENLKLNSHKNSNKWFLEKIFQRITNNEMKHDFSIISNLLLNSISPDLIAYGQLKKLKCNI